MSCRQVDVYALVLNGLECVPITKRIKSLLLFAVRNFAATVRHKASDNP